MPENPDTHVYRTYDKVLAEEKAKKRGRRPAGGGDPNECWPHRLDLAMLDRPYRTADPSDEDYDYAAEFLTLDLDEVARDIEEVLTTSLDWWPADYGHYGPVVLRMAWHAAGTYRVGDGRGGASAGLQRFAPVNSWPDNRNADKARRILWPVKQKYGRKLSWSDLLIFAGNCALESMGFKTLGFAGGRVDPWEADESYWGPETKWLADERHHGLRDLDQPLGASDMGLIYVDPQGPSTNPDPILAGRDIRQTFGRMGFSDEETVALIAGGHTFGKTHGAADVNKYLGPDPESAPMDAQGIGWKSTYGSGKAGDAIVSGLEGIWTPTPTTWDHTFLKTLYDYEWEVELSPAGLWQWVPTDGGGADLVPDAHDPDKKHAPTMLTTDLSLQEDERYEAISRRFMENPEQFEDAFAHAWFKLTHLDMGPRERYLGDKVPQERMLWQDPVPEVDHVLVDEDDVAHLKEEIRATGLTTAQLVFTAWASASTYRDSDKRGGANGARIRLEPQRGWDANDPETLGTVLRALEQVRQRFNDSEREAKVSIADLIVLGGGVAIEDAAARAGHPVTVPFRPGRTDATEEWTDPEWFAHLEPQADGFRNYLGKSGQVPPEHLLLDRASQLTLSAAEMTVLIGGLRVLGANHAQSPLGALTANVGTLSNDFFINLLDMNIIWTVCKDDSAEGATFQAFDQCTGEVPWAASRVDMVFVTNPDLRALCEIYATNGVEQRFVEDFVSAWVKVMELDRYDPPTAARPDAGDL